VPRARFEGEQAPAKDLARLERSTLDTNEATQAADALLARYEQDSQEAGA